MFPGSSDTQPPTDPPGQGSATVQHSTPTVPPPAGPPCPAVPGYEIVELLGRGGMGVVYKARQTKLKRLVALKMLLAGSHAGPEELQRFRIEAEAVARLQHPHIVQIHEVGAEGGLPYFSLEYCAGGSLAQQLDGTPMEPRPAAALVETLARAMSYAHQNGVLHRDLKPANVLLQGAECRTQSDTRHANSGLSTLTSAIPKITDFGLAKKLDDPAGPTRSGAVMGTPSYMAPEQATGVFSTLGPAVDIYALGAMLYEMLTGRPPFQGPDAMQTLLMVVSLEPVPPRSLQPKVPRDLETICLKCLEKSPRRRYASALELADDLRRFQENRPIQARPVRPWERAAKWARRRPAAALLLLVSALAVILLVIGYLQLQLANADLETAKENLQAVNQQLQAAIDETEESLIVARVAIDRNLVRLSDKLAPVPQSEQVRLESLEDARKLYENLAKLRPRDSAGRNHRAEAHGKLGKIYQDLGRLDDAENSYRKALDLWRELRKDNPEDGTHPRAVAGTLNNLANVERQRGRLDKAETLVRAALGEMESLLKAGATDLETLRTMGFLHNTLALAQRSQQKLDDAEKSHRRALESRLRILKLDPKDQETRGDLAVSHSNLATLLMARRPAEAVVELTAAQRLLENQAAPQQRFYLAQVQGNLALALEALQKTSAAEAVHAAALATTTGLATDFSSVPGYRHILARQHLNLASFYGPQGRSEEALRQILLAEPLLERLVHEHPDNAAFRAERARCRQLKQLIEEDLAEAKKKGAK